jgi:hypothetical protein
MQRDATDEMPLGSFGYSRNVRSQAFLHTLVLITQYCFINRTQEENDFLMAKALQESEQEEARRNRATVSILITNPMLIFIFLVGGSNCK